MATAKVNGGVLYFYGIGARGLTMQTKDMMATLDLADTGSFSIPSGAHAAGQIMTLSGNLAGNQTLRFGPAYYQGTNYPKLWYEGSLKFIAAPIAVPGNSAQPVAVRATFTFNGTLRAFTSNNNAGGGGAPVLDVALTGKGTATAYFGATYAGARKPVRDVIAQSYCFASR